MSRRPTLLMISPVAPDITGNGLAMRAGMTLQALSHHYSVTLIILPLYARTARPRIPSELASCCAYIHHPKTLSDEPPSDSPIPESFDVVHIFRLSSLQSARPWFNSSTAIHLDLDDVESVTRQRIANRYLARGRTREAAIEQRHAAAAIDDEIEALIRFDRVYVASQVDHDRLPFCGQADVRTLPNAVAVPALLEPAISQSDMHRFLFVGNLGYFPNQDGILYFAEEILPLLRKRMTARFQIDVVGAGAFPELRALGSIPEINVAGWVADLAEWYAGADVVFIPLLAGGGTRIKLLEALAFQRPIVSTSIGAEGIDVTHGRELLIADDPAEFALALSRLVADVDLRFRLASLGNQLVRRAYTLQSAIAAVTP